MMAPFKCIVKVLTFLKVFAVEFHKILL